MPTITKNGDWADRMNSHMVRIAQYTGPVSYATGGDSFPPESIGLGRIDILLPELAINAAGTIYGLSYNATTKLIEWYVLDTGAEVANATDLSGFSARFVAIGA